jgi:hypothetical protein
MQSNKDLIDELDKYRRMSKQRARKLRASFLREIHHLQKIEWLAKRAEEARASSAGGAA